MKNQIIYVGGEEAELVKAADVIIGDAERTAKEQESQTGLHSPMLFFGTAERAEIVRQVDKMKEDYRASRNLNEMPMSALPISTITARVQRASEETA